MPSRKWTETLNVRSYDTLPPEPEINEAASTSQEPAEPPSKPDPKEVREQKRDQEMARMQKELNKEERPNENCLKLNLN